MRTRPELPASDLRPYPPALARFSAQAWPMKCAEELRSARVFRALRDAARRAGAPFVELANRAHLIAGEETAHARLCSELGAELGASPPLHDPSPVRRRLRGLPRPRSRMAALVLVEVAMGETVSAALFAAARRRTREPLTRAALAAILRDEVGHARFGWAALAMLLPALDADERGALDRELRSGLANLERDVAVPALRRLDAGEPFDPLLAELGVLPPETRVETFYGAIDRAVLPRLQRLGLDGTRAWSERHHLK